MKNTNTQSHENDKPVITRKGTKVVDDLKKFGLIDPEAYTFGESLEDFGEFDHDSLEAFELVGRNLTRVGLKLVHIGQRAAIANHTADASELLFVLAHVQAVEEVQQELRLQADAIVSWFPTGIFQGDEQQVAIMKQLLRGWNISQENQKMLHPRD